MRVGPIYPDSWEREQDMCINYETNYTQHSPSKAESCSAVI
jgi:hypothetical protein